MTNANILFLVATALGCGVLFLVCTTRPHLTFEDGPVETVSATGFATASVLAFTSVLRSSRAMPDRCLRLGLGAFALPLFLSEISFGARILDIQMPAMPGGGDFDGGHDVLLVLLRLVTEGGTGAHLAAATGMGVALIAATLGLYRNRERIRPAVGRLLTDAFQFRLAVAFGLLAIAQSLDLSGGGRAELLEEVVELAAAAALLAALLALPARPPVARADCRSPLDAPIGPPPARRRQPGPSADGPRLETGSSI